MKYRFDYIAFFELFGASLKDGQKYTEIPEIRFIRFFSTSVPCVPYWCILNLIKTRNPEGTHTSILSAKSTVLPLQRLKIHLTFNHFSVEIDLCNANVEDLWKSESFNMIFSILWLIQVIVSIISMHLDRILIFLPIVHTFGFSGFFRVFF